MIIPGRTVLSRQIVCGILSSKHQMQPCGIDLSLKRVLGWKSAGVVDFDNVYRKTSATTQILFQKLHIANEHAPAGSQSRQQPKSRFRSYTSPTNMPPLARRVNPRKVCIWPLVPILLSSTKRWTHRWTQWASCLYAALCSARVL